MKRAAEEGHVARHLAGLIETRTPENANPFNLSQTKSPAIFPVTGLLKMVHPKGFEPLAS